MAFNGLLSGRHVAVSSVHPDFIKAALTDAQFGVYGIRQSQAIKVFCAGWEL